MSLHRLVAQPHAITVGVASWSLPELLARNLQVMLKLQTNSE